MHARTHYEILSIEQSASVEEIKNAYFNLIRIHAPDRGGDSETFNKILEAYRTLSSPEKKGQYDQKLERDKLSSDFFQSFKELRELVHSYRYSEFSKAYLGFSGNMVCNIIAVMLAYNEYEYSSYVFMIGGMGALGYALSKFIPFIRQEQRDAESFRLFANKVIECYEMDKLMTEACTPRLTWK
jgi:curved DNA-binding protein CbpA